MAQNPSISFTTAEGKEYRFVLAGQPNDGLNTLFIVSMFGFILLSSLIISISGFALGNVLMGFLGLALFLSPFAVIAFAAKINRN